MYLVLKHFVLKREKRFIKIFLKTKMKIGRQTPDPGSTFAVFET